MVKIRVQYLSSTTVDYDWNREPLNETIEALFTKFNFHGTAADYILRNDATKQNLTEQVRIFYIIFILFLFFFKISI